MSIKRSGLALLALLMLVALAAAGCGGSSSGGSTSSSGDAASGATQSASAGDATTQSSDTSSSNKWFDQAVFDKQMQQSQASPDGPANEPWNQAIDPQWVDTSKYKKAGPWKICFSNASLTNPWRTVGWQTMQQEVKLQGSKIKSFKGVDAGGQDAKQISDISDLLTQGCDALVISPNTTGPLTKAVEQACQKVPVIVFDRGVQTDCPVTFVHPIGGFLFGADAANFLVKNVKKGGKVLALRILPGVDVLEQRWAAAEHIFKQNGIDVVGQEFTGSDPAKTKQIVSDYIQREGQLDGVWMDAGDTAVAAGEAFEDAGAEVPPITGEDVNNFLSTWKDKGWKGEAPTYPTYQWRTAIIAATKVLSGQKVPKEWILPQPEITQDTLDKYVAPNMPPTFYAMCGCQDMPGFPQAWGGK